MTPNLVKKLYLATFFLVINLPAIAQAPDKLVQIDFDSVDKVYIVENTLKSLENKDIFVWTETSHHVPLTIESVNDKIYKTRTNYLLNTKLKKYALLGVIYYDEDGNVLKSFDYNSKSDLENYKYNFPVIPGSETEAIMNKCSELLDK